MPKSSVSKFCGNIKKFDLYSKEIKFAYDNGSKSLKSWLGVFVGLAITSILVFYAHLKLTILLRHQDITIMEPIKQNYFDESYEITSKIGFNVAFGIINYDTSSEASYGDQYGQVKMYERIWGQVDETTGEIKATYLKEVETEPC